MFEVNFTQFKRKKSNYANGVWLNTETDWLLFTDICSYCRKHFHWSNRQTPPSLFKLFSHVDENAYYSAKTMEDRMLVLLPNAQVKEKIFGNQDATMEIPLM